MPMFLLEAYAPRGSHVSALVAQARASECDGVRYLRSIFVPQDELCFHLFEGSPAVVAAIAQRPEFDNGRVVEAVEGP